MSPDFRLDPTALSPLPSSSSEWRTTSTGSMTACRPSLQPFRPLVRPCMDSDAFFAPGLTWSSRETAKLISPAITSSEPPKIGADQSESLPGALQLLYRHWSRARFAYSVSPSWSDPRRGRLASAPDFCAFSQVFGVLFLYQTSQGR